MCGYMFEDYPTNKSTFWEGTVKALHLSFRVRYAGPSLQMEILALKFE